MKETALVFVYGSLKRGYWNNRLLEGALFVGEAHTTKKYSLVDGGVPMAVPDEEGLPVMGEVYEIDVSLHLGPLDRLEGHPRFYTREQVGVVLKGEVCNAYIYEMQYTYRDGDMCQVVDDKYVWNR